MTTIINAHAHLIDLPGMAQRFGGMSLPGGISVLRDIKATIPLLDPHALLDQMDEAGVAQTILYAVEAPIVYASNEYVHGMCSQWPDRFIGFASVNPLDPRAPRQLERAVRELGLKGLKLHPPLQQFSPDDPAVFDVYAKAAELNIPVVFHVGTTPFGALCRLAHANPLLIDEVAVRFPQLRILLTHLGTLWHNEAFMVVEKNPNVFIDTAAYVTEIQQILTRDLITRIGENKIIFGTDFPMPYADRPHRLKEFVECIRGLDIPARVREDILGGNVHRLLNGDAETDSAALSMQDVMKMVQATAAAREPVSR